MKASLFLLHTDILSDHVSLTQLESLIKIHGRLTSRTADRK